VNRAACCCPVVFEEGENTGFAMEKIYRVLLIIMLVCLPAGSLFADNETCFECHGDDELTAERGGREVSMFVSDVKFGQSVHADLECIDCHQDADVEDFPHDEDLENVYCGMCHDDAQLNYDAGIHGIGYKQKAVYAPSCADCHGKHDILSSKNEKSPTYMMNVPILCGKCHREGAPVANTYKISEHNIIENYSQSIHGEGLFKKGLTVTATCVSCHNSHMILPRTYANSSVAPRNIAQTCMRCHSKIEEVHTKIIRGELWESAPGAIPACTDCHLPHRARKESVALNVSDRSCLKCHEKEDVHKMVDGEKVSLVVKKADLADSEHRNLPCVKCHSDINPKLHRPCETAGKIDCSTCHAKVSDEYYASGHGQQYVKGNENVPYCTDCHGSHTVVSHLKEESPSYRANIPTMCGECHRESGKAMSNPNLHEKDALADYSTSVHGRGLTEKGLLPSAICVDCHNTHLILPLEDPASSINKQNVPATCSTCHRGIFKEFNKSIHFATVDDHRKNLPTCSDCHSSHTIQRVDQDRFVFQVTNQCGSCHKDLADSYFDTMHGKAYTLGYMEAAKCSDCHGAHEILGINDPNSSVGYKNVVTTCQKCHEDANERFTGYLTHATHHDPVRYPVLYYTYWAMTSLLIGVFGFFGLHTLLWMPRSIKAALERRKHHKAGDEKYFFRRFTRSQRLTHIFVIFSFLILAMTGMILKFASMPWARFVSDAMGGVRNAGLLHRFAAIITFGYFAFHVYSLLKRKSETKQTWKDFIFGPNSMMFNLNDLKDFGGTIKWFFGLGKRPDYGRWTYWEKFDYFAVFWGVAVIGLSGLLQWFPEFFTLFLPGWLINVAAIIHSDEALLATGFIFTVHFFNTHLRPEAFPMDKVIFTGLVPLEEYKQDRPREYEELKAKGKLEEHLVTTPVSESRDRLISIFGYTALTVGILLVVMIIYSVLFAYK
jgi:cytochrome b subunit of formate dehydrogenase